MVKLPKHPIYLSNFHFGPSRGPFRNFTAKIGQSEVHSSKVRGLAQMATWGCKWRPHQVWESTPCCHSDFGRQMATQLVTWRDKGAKWEEFGEKMDGRIPAN